MIACLECGAVLHPNLFNAYRRELGFRKRKLYHNDFECFNCQDSCLIELDDLIGDRILQLNSKGYVTRNCCAGHPNDKSVGGYIQFWSTPDLPSIPRGWEFESAVMGDDSIDAFIQVQKNISNSLCGIWDERKYKLINTRTIRYRFENGENKTEKINQMMANLSVWVDGLQPV